MCLSVLMLATVMSILILSLPFFFLGTIGKSHLCNVINLASVCNLVNDQIHHAKNMIGARRLHCIISAY